MTLQLVKASIPVTTTAYDDVLRALIEAAVQDLRIAGINADDYETDPLLRRAVVTYCRANFGSPADYDKLKAAYDEQKAQLQMSRWYGMERILYDEI
jgi:hypothetical protein